MFIHTIANTSMNTGKNANISNLNAYSNISTITNLSAFYQYSAQRIGVKKLWSKIQKYNLNVILKCESKCDIQLSFYKLIQQILHW